MLKKNKILAIIPARGNSKGIFKKNIKKLNGKPLIIYTIEAAKKSKYIDKIVVSTENNEIERIVKKLKVEIIKRPKKLAKDTTPTKPVIIDTINQLESKNFFSDVIIILQATSPLRNTDDIDNSILKFEKEDCDLVVGVCEVNNAPFLMYTINKKNNLISFLRKKQVLRRQDFPKLYYLNGSIFVTSKKHLFKNKAIMSGKMVPLKMPQERSIDIDSNLDFHIAELLMKNKLKI